MPPPAVQRIASALLALAGVLLMFKAVPFRRYRVELSGLPDRCRHLPAGTGRSPRGGRPPGVFAASGVADSCKRTVRPLTRLTGVAAVAGVVHYVVCVRVNESRLRMRQQTLRPGLVRVEVVA
jgi:hypothetical protein